MSLKDSLQSPSLGWCMVNYCKITVKSHESFFMLFEYFFHSTTTFYTRILLNAHVKIGDFMPFAYLMISVCLSVRLNLHFCTKHLQSPSIEGLKPMLVHYFYSSSFPLPLFHIITSHSVLPPQTVMCIDKCP